MARTPQVIVQLAKEGGWNLKVGKEIQKTYRTQAEAWDAGKKLAKKLKAELTVFGKNGQIRSKDSYGNESKVKDKEN